MEMKVSMKKSVKMWTSRTIRTQWNTLS